MKTVVSLNQALDIYIDMSSYTNNVGELSIALFTFTFITIYVCMKQYLHTPRLRVVLLCVRISEKCEIMGCHSSAIKHVLYQTKWEQSN